MVFAHYSTFSLSGDGKHFNMLWVGGESNDFEVDDIYIRLHDGKTHNLRLLTEDNAKEWIAREPNPTVRELTVGEGKRAGMDATFYEFSGNNLLIFHQGKLIDGCLSNMPASPFTDLEVSLSPEGEFVKLPLAKEEMVRLFGKPKSIEETRLKGQ